MRTAKRAAASVCFCVLFVLLTVCASAEGIYRVDDRAELFSEDQKRVLYDDLTALSGYMNAAVLTEQSVGEDTEGYARRYAKSVFDASPAMVFFIDMEHRQIYIYCNTAGLRVISRADARAITDNVYETASKGNYGLCAHKALSQVLTKCEGGRIARPVKHITNVLISLLAGILINYVVMVFSRLKALKASSASYRMSHVPKLTLESPRLIDIRRIEKDSRGRSRGGGFGGGGGGGGGHGF